MLSELIVESFYAYIPESHDSDHPEARASQKLTYAIKDGDRIRVPGRGWASSHRLAAERVARDLPTRFGLRRALTLVPIPGSLQLPPVPGPHYSVSRKIAEALVAENVGAVVEDILVRLKSMEKASRGGPRDAILHRDSLGVVEGAPPPKEPVVLIDDVTTSGAQMVGAALRLVDAFPGLTGVQGFALIRTVGEDEFKAIHDPVQRVARLISGDGGVCTFSHRGPDPENRPG